MFIWPLADSTLSPGQPCYGNVASMAVYTTQSPKFDKLKVKLDEMDQKLDRIQNNMTGVKKDFGLLMDKQDKVEKKQLEVMQL